VRRLVPARVLFAGWTGLVLLFLYVPILIVVIFAFNKNRDVTLWTGFTPDWFGRSLRDTLYTDAVLTSLKIAVLSSIISTVIGTAAALALARMKRSLRLPFDIVVYLTLVVPEIVIAVASLIFFVQARANAGGIVPPLGWKTILLAHCVFNSSLVMLIVRARFVGMGSSLEEASFDLGAPPLSTFRQITLPRLFPAILAASLLSLAFSFDDYVLSVFTAGTTQTWPIVIYNAVRFGVTPEINALAAIMLAVTIGAIVIAAVVLRRSRGSGTDAQGGIGAALGLG